MKILSISGENLASLGKFEVKLDEGVLGSAGLFAIVGPTGAGKSTLLDAMCLALYGVTPRSNDAGSTRVANANGEAWTAGDERQIVRRGTTQAVAEVVFEVLRGAGTKETYVARWSVGVNREGVFRAPSMVVKCGGEVKATGKRAVADFVESTIGMDFDNFCRSVLLAQGAFAAFLKAKGSDRSHVLEVLTDPNKVYRRLSIAAHKKGSAAAALLKNASEAVEAVTVLDAVARAGTEAALVRLAGDLDDLGARGAEVASERVRWLAVDDAEGDLARVRLTAQGAETAWEQLAPARTVVEEHDSVQAVVAPRALLHEAGVAVTRADAALAASAMALSQVESAVMGQALIVDGARAAVQALEGSFAEGSADRAAALRLDTVVALGETERITRAAALTALEGRLGALKSHETVLDTRAVALEARAQAVAAWHLGHPSAALLAARADAWRAPLGRTIDETHAGDEAERRRAVRVREHGTASGDAVTAVTTHEAALAVEQVARATVIALEADEEAARGQAPAGRVAEATGHSELLRQLERRRVEAEGVRTRSLEETERHAEAVRETLAARDAAATHAEAMRTLGSELESAREAELLARIQAGSAEMRATLVEGEPCQVCGSHTHPWSEPGALVAPHEATRRRTAAETLWTEVSNAHALATTQAATAAARAQASDANVVHLHAQLAAWDADWTASVAPLAGAADLPMFDDNGRLATRVAAAEQDLAAARTAEQRLEAARVAAFDARVHRDATIVSTQVALAGRTAADVRATAAANAVAQEEQAVAGHRERRETAWQEAAPVLTGIPDAESLFRTQPDLARSTWNAQVAGVVEQAAEQARIDIELYDLATARAAHHASRAETEAHVVPARASLAEQEARLVASRGERALLLGGRAVSEVEQAHAAAHATLAGALERESAALARARETVASRTSDVTHHTATCTEAQATLAVRRDAYATALAATGLDEAECTRRLAHDPVLVRAYRQESQGAADARVASGLQVTAAAAQLAAAQAALPARARDLLEADALAIEAARDAANREIGANRQVLESDDAQHTLRQIREAELRALESEHGVWGRLAQVIGHGEGNTFAMFAQSLSFDSLLQAANNEIKRVRPRYELTSVPPTEAASAALEMAVRDTEFGGESRPLSTLSGGETFLVSLSMALGLSALTAKRRSLGTLFIDEGFGTLDAETLALALDALRTLQGRGTQVGIISHVGDLAELTPARVRVVKVSEGLSIVVTE